MKHLLHSILAASAGLAILWLAPADSRAQSAPEPQLHDPVAELNRQLAAGETSLEYRDDGWGYLTSVMEHLDLNADSQALVFSRTSLQQDFISPEHPRAIYFNDTVTMGFVDQAPLFELTSLDPEQGLIFYTLEQARSDAPRFVRDDGLCGACHAAMNRWASGIAVATAYTAADGRPFFLGRNLFDVTDHRSPFETRWGGWYVTGTHGSMPHHGNAISPNIYRPYDLDLENNTNVTSLKGRFNVDRYLTPHSDLIALMTLEHQTQMIDYITSVAAQARRVGTLGTDQSRRPSEEEFSRTIEDMVAYMVFAEEAPLTDPIRGTSTFTQTFPERGPRDGQGRSLRDFNLQNRLFQYPLSYMIYTEAFDKIPPRALDRIYRRVYEVLSGQDQGERYARLDPEARKAALDILRATKPSLPAYYRP